MIFSEMYKPSRAELERSLYLKRNKTSSSVLAADTKVTVWRDGSVGEEHGSLLERTMVPLPIPSTHLVAHIYLELQSQGTCHPLLAFTGTRHADGAHMYTQAKQRPCTYK